MKSLIKFSKYPIFLPPQRIYKCTLLKWMITCDKISAIYSVIISLIQDSSSISFLKYICLF